MKIINQILQPSPVSIVQYFRILGQKKNYSGIDIWLLLLFYNMALVNVISGGRIFSNISEVNRRILTNRTPLALDIVQHEIPFLISNPGTKY